MQYCLLYVFFVLTFTQLLRYALIRGSGVFVVSAVNYVAAAVLAAALLAGLWGQVPSSGRWLGAGMGATTGVLYFLNLLVMLVAYRQVGVGITAALAGMGIVIPVLVSWYAWGEPMTAARWAAVAMLLPAVVLMRPHAKARRPLSLKGDVVLLLVFLIPGTVGTIHKSVSVYIPQTAHPVYQSVLYQSALFGAAAVVSVGYVWARRLEYDRNSVALGSILGTANVLATFFVLLALGSMRAVVLYPTSSSLMIGGSVVVSWILWGERVTVRQVAGLCLAVGVVVLCNV